MAEFSKFLDESGLTHFWNKKIKPLIYRKATLQEDLVVKNPRVTVDLEEGYTFKAGSTMEDMFKYLYRHVYEETQPEMSVILPSVTVQISIPETAEVNDTVTYAVSKKSFNQGKVGSCIEPWEKEPQQGLILSGSTEKTSEFKIYSGTTNDPEECTTELSMTGSTVTGSFNVAKPGSNALGTYFCGATGYTESTATSKTSYGNPANDVPGITSFSEGTTAKSPCVTGAVTGYYPSFGNISFTSSTSSPSNITNLGNKMNKVGTTEFYYGPVNTVGPNNTSFEIYFIATVKSATVQYWDTITSAWVNVPTTLTSGHFATMPAKNDTSRWPNGSLKTGTEYKLTRLASGNAYGARRYRLILA